MIPFIETTWPLWWLVIILVILRWFHVMASRPSTKRGKSGSNLEAVPAATVNRSSQRVALSRSFGIGN